MDPRRVWPDFRDSWVVAHDDALIVVDKPVGMPSQEAEAARGDGLVTRLKAWLEARGEDPYLGVHQRLDLDTSGVVVMTRRREVNANVAAQFEGRKVRKTYLAGVTGWRGKGEVTLRTRIDGKPAVSHVTVRARKGERAIVEVALETGRTHQARIHLADAGAPIAGDRLYGGAPAPRLLLHAHALSMVHPTKGRPVTFTAPAPPELEAWLARGDLGADIYRDARALDSALMHAIERRWFLGRSASTDAFRLVNEAGDALPGLAVDVYGSHLVAQLYDELAEEASHADRERVLDRLDALGFDGVYLKVRPRQANTLVDTRREDLAPKLPVRGTPTATEEIIVHEEGVPYGVRLGDGLSTGIFLDQRANRARVRAMSKGLRVANLFSYTCGFSVVAAMGGAKSTVSVDASMAALERGRANVARVAPLEGHTFVADDAFSWLARVAKKPEPRFDLIVLDPPSYSTTKSRRFVASSHYAQLVEAATRVLAPGGRLLCSTNHRGIGRAKLRRAVGAGVRQAGREAKQIKDLPDSPDFPPPVGEEAYMKAVLAIVV